MPDSFNLTTGELARHLGVREIVIQNLVRYQLVLPPMVWGGRRCWRPDDVERVRAVLVARGVIAEGGR